MKANKIYPILNKVEHTDVEFGKPFNLDTETVITPFNYSRGNRGYMCKQDGHEFNLTVNLMDTNEYTGNIILKMYGDAEVVNQKFIERFTKVKPILIGINRAYVVV